MSHNSDAIVLEAWIHQNLMSLSQPPAKACMINLLALHVAWGELESENICLYW
jgi:hypothetical protein